MSTDPKDSNPEKDDSKDIYNDLTYTDQFADDDFGFLGSYDQEEVKDELLLDENVADSAINCAFIGLGGGGGKIAKAFLDIGFNKTLLVNTTEKDQPSNLDPKNFVHLEGADGVGKDIALGRSVLSENSAVIEDTLRTRLGKVDWIFVSAG